MNPNEDTGETMLEGSDVAPAPMTEDCVPLSALAMPDEGEQMQNPEVGDKVQVNIEGTVSRIEGENAYIKREAVNGNPVGESEAPKDEFTELQSIAKAQPEDY